MLKSAFASNLKCCYSSRVNAAWLALLEQDDTSTQLQVSIVFFSQYYQRRKVLVSSGARIVEIDEANQMHPAAFCRVYNINNFNTMRRVWRNKKVVLCAIFSHIRI